MKIGFSEDKTNEFVKELDNVYICFYIVRKDLEIRKLIDVKFIDDEYLFKHNVKYLHQLQNAYYCLTGEELNVEL